MYLVGLLAHVAGKCIFEFWFGKKKKNILFDLINLHHHNICHKL